MPGPLGEGCVRRGIVADAEGLVVNLQRLEEANVIIRGEEGAADETFALRRDVGEVLADMKSAGGPVKLVEALLADVLDTRVAANADLLARSGAQQMSLSNAQRDLAQEIGSFETQAAELGADAAIAAAQDSAAHTAAAARYASISTTFAAVASAHGDNDGTHTDLSEKVKETLGEAVRLGAVLFWERCQDAVDVCHALSFFPFSATPASHPPLSLSNQKLASVSSDSRTEESLLSSAIASKRVDALGRLANEEVAQTAEGTRHAAATVLPSNRLDCETGLSGKGAHSCYIPALLG